MIAKNVIHTRFFSLTSHQSARVSRAVPVGSFVRSTKRAATPPAASSPPPVDTGPESEYEIKRKSNIAQNRKKLQQLGLEERQ